MRIGPLPRAQASSGRLPGILLRVLSVFVSAGLAVAAVEVWSTESEKPVRAAPGPPQVAPAAGPQDAPEPWQGAGPRVVHAGPNVSSAATSQQEPALQAAEASPLAVISSDAVQAVSTRATPVGTAPPPVPSASSSEAAPPHTHLQVSIGSAVAPTGSAARQVAAIEEPPKQPSDPAGRLVDLNSAKLEELNGLKGGGRIGRAIMRGRPYTSPEDLLMKKVLNRATYDRIKDQVTAQ